MLRTLADLTGYSIGATDGEIGQVKEFYFDDEAWIIRYFSSKPARGFRAEKYSSPRYRWASRTGRQGNC